MLVFLRDLAKNKMPLIHLQREIFQILKVKIKRYDIEESSKDNDN
jgi:hypothetical protein